MFSNQSVSVQPSAPPIDTGGVPDSKTVSEVLRKSAQVFGTVAPAFSKAAVLYQIIDLLETLAYTPYCLPFQEPSFCQPGEKFLLSSACASAPSGFSQPLSANWWSTPFWARKATSGGAPPSIFVPRKVDWLSPVGTKVLLAPVRLSNSSSTFWKFACSGPVHTAATSIFCPCRSGSCSPEVELADVEELASALSSLLPQAVAVKVSADAASAASAM